MAVAVRRCGVVGRGVEAVLVARHGVAGDQVVAGAGHDGVVASISGSGVARLRVVGRSRRDRKSTRLNSVTNAHLVCRLLLEKKNNKKKHIYKYTTQQCIYTLQNTS